MEISTKTLGYWTPEDFADVEKAETYKDLYVIAQRVILRMPKPFGQVCGPIATGGLGSIEANLHAFNETIKKLQSEGRVVFDQIPFEEPMQKIKNDLKPGEYAEAILTDFYRPLFESGNIDTFYFMPNWQTSRGANWEHGEAERLGIKIVYL
jgi:hypothetical protein